MWAFWLISGISKQRVEIRLIGNYTVMQFLPSTFGLFNPIHGELQLNLQQNYIALDLVNDIISLFLL